MPGSAGSRVDPPGRAGFQNYALELKKEEREKKDYMRLRNQKNYLRGSN
jgi:hypothetical protein